MKFMRRYALILATTLVLLFGSTGVASAQGFQQQMQDTFGSMVSVTQPQVVMGSTRGVITGGNFTVKNKVMSADLYSLQMPRIRMGCGGWDIFGGSFSFISSDQIVSMLRSIAASAVAYAFKLALCTISDDICNQLEALWKDNIFANLMGKNSCELGAALVDMTGFKGFKTQANQAAANKGMEEGYKEDAADAQNNMESDSPAAQAAERANNAGDAEAKKAIISGNHIWEAMKQHGGSVWNAFGGSQFMEDVMSVTGTTIVCVPSLNACPNSGGTATIGQKDAVVVTRAPLMGLSEVVKGRMEYSQVKRWRCNDSGDCLNPSEETATNFIGTEELLRKALLGPNEQMGEGLIGRYAANAPKQAGDDGLITAGGAFVAMALNLASRSERDARDFVETFIEIIAADITYRIINESLGKVSSAVSSYQGGGATDAQEMVLRARVNLTEEIKKFHSNNEVNTSKWTYYQGLVQARPPVRLPAIAVGTSK